MIEKLKKIEKEVPLKPVHKILLTTDGSITRIIESLMGENIEVETIQQQVIEADREMAQKLGIYVKEEVNFREVNLTAGKRNMVYALSLTPVKRLKPGFKRDIMKKDIPIGKIMEKLRIEARRELIDFWAEKADDRMAKNFDVKEGDLLFKREYNIIHRKKIFLNITEAFPYRFTGRL